MPQSLAKILVHLIYSTKNREPFLVEDHRRKTFQEEFREFLKRHQIPYDERYVWD